MSRLFKVLLLCFLIPVPSASAQDRPSRESFMLRHVDKDNDGVLSPSEFHYILAASKNKIDPNKDYFGEADLNGDGVVDIEELKVWLRRDN